MLMERLRSLVVGPDRWRTTSSWCGQEAARVGYSLWADVRDRADPDPRIAHAALAGLTTPARSPDNSQGGLVTTRV
jgi:hypothetical protein